MTGPILMLLAAGVALGDDAVIAQLHVRIEARDVAVTSCRDVMNEPEAGLATIGFRFRIDDAHALGNGRYTGAVVFELGDVTVEVPKSISWPDMSAGDLERAEALRRAIVHHEIGHVRVAAAVRDALNDARTPIVAPDVFSFRAQADDAGRTGFERFTRAERDYDALTDHGRNQRAATGALAGPDTELRCDTAG